MRIDDLLVSDDRRDMAAAPEVDALVDDGALAEAALFDIRMDLVRGAMWMLFDCRGALQISAGNTAVLVVQAVRSVHWAGCVVEPRVWRAVSGWKVRRSHSRLLEFEITMEPTATLRVAGTSGEFFVGDVPGCDDAPPDFLAASDEEVRAGLQSWASIFNPIHASFSD